MVVVLRTMGAGPRAPAAVGTRLAARLALKDRVERPGAGAAAVATTAEATRFTRSVRLVMGAIETVPDRTARGGSCRRPEEGDRTAAAQGTAPRADAIVTTETMVSGLSGGWGVEGGAACGYISGVCTVHKAPETVAVHHEPYGGTKSFHLPNSSAQPEQFLSLESWK